MRRAAALRALTAALVCVLVAAPAAGADEKPLEIWVSILPQADLVGRLGGDRVSVHVLVGPGRSPATYEPGPRQMADLARADLLIRAGVPFEDTLLDKIRANFADLEVLDRLDELDLAPMERAEGHDHGHHHGAGDLDPHFWLDPVRLGTHADQVTAALKRLRPGWTAELEERHRHFESRLQETTARIEELLAPLRGSPLLVFHPAYGYFTRRFGLEQMAVQVEGKEPGGRRMVELVERVKAAGVETVHVQPQFSSHTAKVLADAIGGRVVTLDPLPEDCLAGLLTMAERIAEHSGP